jgi:hypothetical protein
LDPVVHISTPPVLSFWKTVLMQVWFQTRSGYPMHSPKLFFFWRGGIVPPIKCDHLHQLPT